MQLDSVVCCDALELLRSLPDNSIDCIVTDPPYGAEKTKQKWDKDIDIPAMFAEWRRVIKRRGAIVLFAAQPFSSKLIQHAGDIYRYSWYYEKPRGANFGNSDLQPLRVIEEALVFSLSIASKNQFTSSDDCMVYYPQKIKLARPYTREDKPHHRRIANPSLASHVHNPEQHRIKEYEYTTPVSLLYASTDSERGLHPNQKPIDVVEYLIRTYTLEGETILDCYSGSGTTAAACLKTGRHYIVGDNDAHYCEVTRQRLLHTSKEELKAALTGKPTTHPMFA